MSSKNRSANELQRTDTQSYYRTYTCVYSQLDGQTNHEPIIGSWLVFIASEETRQESETWTVAALIGLKTTTSLDVHSLLTW